mmetsp:Transcript_20005/g.27577  ORF Transcript_20005/g.27577 Transcript_20005/m.27577 type:complete len:297 (-) Transcript_20005:155-1045(-)
MLARAKAAVETEERRELEEERRELEEERRELEKERRREREEEGLEIGVEVRREDDDSEQQSEKEAPLQKKHIAVLSGNEFITFNVYDDYEFQYIARLNEWIGFKEIQQIQSPNVLFHWNEMKNNSIYIPNNIKINKKQLEQKLYNLAKSIAECNSHVYLKDHFGLDSIGDVEYIGSDIKLTMKEDSTLLGDIDSLFKIPRLKLYILLERKTTTTATVGSDSILDLLKQMHKTRAAFELVRKENAIFREKYHVTADEGFTVRSALYLVAGDPLVEAALLKEDILVVNDAITFTIPLI